MRNRTLGLSVAILALWASSAAAQLRSVPYVSGLSAPLAFIQDTADTANQYVVQQGGQIRLIRNGVLQSTPFLNLAGQITSGGERGLLGMALAPDWATSGRFFVNFTNLEGHTVIARFTRSVANPLIADSATRLELLWSTGERFIRQPFANHNGGTLQFGPDGFLYIGMGDGGSGNDPNHLAQNPDSLLGKMLRIDVAVADGDTKGFRIPPGNPFAGSSRPEIWDFGLRNPFKFSFDDPARGGTGALIIADVGQNAWEEVNYEPAGQGGRNYGWRNREGAHDNVTSLPPAFRPLVDPIFEYPHPTGFSITGGYVYRGTALGPNFRGRYFFADFVSQRVWSIALTIDGSGNATASDLRDHSAELRSGNTSSFGVDAAGELYLVDLNAGTVVKIGIDPAAVAPVMNIDTPTQGQQVRQPFLIGGWALDPIATTDPGIDAVHVWSYPISAIAGPVTGDPTFLGVASYGASRPDVASAFGGSQFTNSGFNLVTRSQFPGTYRIAVFAHVQSTGSFSLVRSVDVAIQPTSITQVDTPSAGATVGASFVVGGWAIDTAASAGTGIDAVHVWMVPAGGGSFTFAGSTTAFGDRPDVGNIFGPQFTRSGYTIVVTAPPNGQWDVLVFARSTVTGQFQPAVVRRITVNR
jgi:glucose/arabinose dehydrogenase